MSSTDKVACHILHALAGVSAVVALFEPVFLAVGLALTLSSCVIIVDALSEEP